MFLFAGVGPSAFLGLDLSATAAELEVLSEFLTLFLVHALIHFLPLLPQVPVEEMASGAASLLSEAVGLAAAVGAVLNLIHLPHRGGLINIHLSFSFIE